jgi:hypothetical protein
LLGGVNTTIGYPPRRGAAASLAAAALVGLLAIGTGPIAVPDVLHPPGSRPAQSLPPAPAPIDRAGTRVRIELVAGDHTATAILDDTPQARAFAAMLPVTVEMKDPFGQAKTGQLPRALAVTGAEPSRSYAAGDLAYWSPSNSVAVVYDALGRSVPPPGLVHLGTVQTGLRDIASAGNDFPMTIRRV